MELIGWLLFITLKQNSSKICVLIPRRLTRQRQHKKGAFSVSEVHASHPALTGVKGSDPGKQ